MANILATNFRVVVVGAAGKPHLNANAVAGVSHRPSQCQSVGSRAEFIIPHVLLCAFRLLSQPAPQLDTDNRFVIIRWLMTLHLFCSFPVG